mmetsp:Transcript_47712/g.102216  ORF Transcript_47712/g.102216 Transcript_47712/m.102216 type:complete len:393 (+) Transcript_47712:86-1264(+)|eukprot:CAMPEP_0206437896 /NCGR_PEP_ID=MMETSP0324_2-20121206/11301_1 /ASSEMBLY_ACC=CAM_ASM_000836 /TAXON_ID=2866 /ORGANISM="Crypthecodinium cohnii, Strain Seligo" /LENGTH=392 /DNA_ID=CAMNT_0053905239 /DNA_START=20 /DNA_END=1198 /DNA_ORIENTATION=-
MGSAAKIWEVVGGADKGGILVRAGAATTSEQLPDRLSTGAIVEELELAGERLHYSRVSGTGPSTGWVSIKLKEKALLQPVEKPASASVQDESVEKTAAADALTPIAAATSALLEVREGDYYVTLGVVFKKPGESPEGQKVISLNRKVGHVIHTTGKVWKGPSGGFWVQLDTSRGDTGAGEKPGWVMVDAAGFGTPGPCLQKANIEEPPLLLSARAPPGGKAWDNKEPLLREFLVLPSSTVEEVKTILGMLFGLKGALSIFGPAGSTQLLEDTTTVSVAGWKVGDEVKFKAELSKELSLVVMSPVEPGKQLCKLELTEEASVGHAKGLLSKITGLKLGSMIMVKGKMGERVSEDANLDDKQSLVSSGYKSGDEIGFIYTGDLEGDLSSFLAKQ